jgi:hypothetical protein
MIMKLGDAIMLTIAKSSEDATLCGARYAPEKCARQTKSIAVPRAISIAATRDHFGVASCRVDAFGTASGGSENLRIIHHLVALRIPDREPRDGALGWSDNHVFAIIMPPVHKKKLAD